MFPSSSIVRANGNAPSSPTTTKASNTASPSSIGTAKAATPSSPTSFSGIDLYRYAKNKWTRTEISKGNPDPWPKSGTSDVAVGHTAKQRFLATIEPWHGNKVAVYTEHRGQWQREVIDDSLLDAHTILTADLDGNGRDAIVAGMRGKPYQVLIYSRPTTNPIIGPGRSSTREPWPPRPAPPSTSTPTIASI